MVLRTIIIDVPEGYNVRNSIYKVKTLDPQYVETRGRKPYMDQATLEEREGRSKWQAENRDKIKISNKRYYEKKKAEKAVPE